MEIAQVILACVVLLAIPAAMTDGEPWLAELVKIVAFYVTVLAVPALFFQDGRDLVLGGYGLALILLLPTWAVSGVVMAAWAALRD